MLESKGIVVDPDSKPESDGDDPNNIDHKYDGSDQTDVNPVGETSPIASFLLDITPHLHYFESVNVAMVWILRIEEMWRT